MSRTMLVTGTSKGIGRAIAVRLAQDGYHIVAHFGRDQTGADQTLSLIQATGGTARLLSCDIADRTACQTTFERDLAEHGPYYGVVLNAGIARDAAFPALSDEDWDGVLDTNLGGFYNVLKPIVMAMISARAGGRIVTLSSVSGMVGNRGQVNYSAAKAGIIGATKALAVELAKRNITVNCVAPGLIETQMIVDLPLDEIRKTIPMQRLGKPDDVAAAVSYLCSDQAAYVTRQVLAVNGGLA
jgi:3-oxoacyl-[acyl-carrier protein] reductase